MYYQSSFPEKPTPLKKCFGEERPVSRHRRLTFAETPNILSPLTHADEEKAPEDLESFSQVLKGQPVRQTASTDSELSQIELPRKPHRKPHPRNEFPELPTFYNLHNFEVIKPPRSHHSGYTSLSSVTTNSDISRYEWIPLDLRAGQQVLYSNTYIVSTETESTMSNRVRGARESLGSQGRRESQGARESLGSQGARESRGSQETRLWPPGGMEEVDEDDDNYSLDYNDEEYEDYFDGNEANGNQGAKKENEYDAGMNKEPRGNSLDSDDYKGNTENGNTENDNNQRLSYEKSNGDTSPPPEQRNQQQNASWSDFELTHSNVMGPTLDDLIYWLAPMLGITGPRPTAEASESGEPAAPSDPPPETFELLHGALGPPPDESILAGLQSFFRMLGLVSPEKNADDSGEPNMGTATNEKGDKQERPSNTYEVRALTRTRKKQQNNGNASDQSRMSDPYIRELVRPAGPLDQDGMSSPDSDKNTPLQGRPRCTAFEPCGRADCRMHYHQHRQRYQQQQHQRRKVASASPGATRSGNQQTSFKHIPAATSTRPATAGSAPPQPQPQPYYRRTIKMERHVQHSLKPYPPHPKPQPQPQPKRTTKIRKVDRQEPQPYIERTVTSQIEKIYDTEEEATSEIENIEPERPLPQPEPFSVYMPPPRYHSPPSSTPKSPPEKPQIKEIEEFTKPPIQEYQPRRQSIPEKYVEPLVQKLPPERHIMSKPTSKVTETETKDKMSLIEKYERKQTSSSKEKKNTKTSWEHKPVKEKNIPPSPERYVATKEVQKRSTTKRETKATQSEKYEQFPAKKSIAKMIPIREASIHDVYRPPPPVIQTPSPEPFFHEPYFREPSFHEPSFHEPPFHEPSFHEPSFHKPPFHVPPFHEPSFHEPPVHEPSVDEPPVHEPPVHEPPVYEPSFHRPPVHKPSSHEPPIHKPPVHKPLVQRPSILKPPGHEPSLHEPPVQVPSLHEPPHNEPTSHEPICHEPSCYEPSCRKPACQKQSCSKHLCNEPTCREPPLMDVDPGGATATISMEEIIELTSEPEFPQITEKPRRKSNTTNEEPVSKKESPCRLLIICSSEQGIPCAACCTPCPTLSTIIRNDYRECPGLTTSQSKKGKGRSLSEDTLTKGSFDSKSIERQEVLSYLCASVCDCAQEGQQSPQYGEHRKSSKTKRRSTDSERIPIKRAQSKDSMKSNDSRSDESNRTRPSISKSESTLNGGSTAEIPSREYYCELENPASSQSVLEGRRNSGKLYKESSKELKKRRSSGSSQSSFAERRRDRKLCKQISKELKKRKSSGSIAQQKIDGKLSKKKSKELKKQKSSESMKRIVVVCSSGSCNKPECTTHNVYGKKSCPYVKAIASDTSSKKSLYSYSKMSREEAIRRAWNEINSKACHTRCPCPVLEAATSTPDLSANEHQRKETSDKKTSTEITKSAKSKKHKKGSKASLKSKTFPTGCCCNCVCNNNGVVEAKAREMRTMWALTRVNIFDDESRTYEVMALQPKPSIKIPKTSEVVFVVLPGGETINLPQQGGDSMYSKR